MFNQNLARGMFLTAIALFFGLYALQYPIGTLSSAGPGLFPLVVSSLLLLLAVITTAKSRLIDAVPLSFNPRNIGLIMAALAGFVLVAKYVSTLAGIVVLVFVSSFAATSRSWQRNIQVSIGLVAIAFAFERFLGLNLRLFEWKF